MCSFCTVNNKISTLWNVNPFCFPLPGSLYLHYTLSILWEITNERKMKVLHSLVLGILFLYVHDKRHACGCSTSCMIFKHSIIVWNTSSCTDQAFLSFSLSFCLSFIYFFLYCFLFYLSWLPCLSLLLSFCIFFFRYFLFLSAVSMLIFLSFSHHSWT
jgi:hypothetical protein